MVRCLILLTLWFLLNTQLVFADDYSGMPLAHLSKLTSSHTLDQNKLLAAKGNPNAQTELGLCYLYGKGVKKDINAGLKWLKLAAKQGAARAEFMLGMRYLQGDDGLPCQPRIAYQLLLQSARQNLPDAQFVVGMMLYYGKGVEKNKILGRQWLDKAMR